MSRLRIALVDGSGRGAMPREVEQHCRLFARRLVLAYRVDLLTTTPAGLLEIDGVGVRRFEIDPPGNRRRRDELMRSIPAGVSEHEVRRLQLDKPFSSSLLDYLEASRYVYDLFLFYWYRNPAVFFGLPLAGERAVLVPTARPEPALYSAIFDEPFRRARALLCLTPEEAAFLKRRFFEFELDAEVIGTSVDAPPLPGAEPAADVDWLALRERLGTNAFLLCPASPDDPEGLRDLIELFESYLAETRRAGLKLLLLGGGRTRMSDDSHIVAAGEVSGTARYHAFRAARLVCAPSANSVLGTAALEAWRFGKPVLANGASPVLRGLSVRSNGGLWYAGYDEFREAMDLLSQGGSLPETLGRQGREFVAETGSAREFDRRITATLARIAKPGAKHPVERAQATGN